MFHFTFIRFYLRLKVQNSTRITKWDLLYRYECIYIYIASASVLKFETFDGGLKVSKCKTFMSFVYVILQKLFSKAWTSFRWRIKTPVFSYVFIKITEKKRF